MVFENLSLVLKLQQSTHIKAGELAYFEVCFIFLFYVNIISLNINGGLVFVNILSPAR